MGRLCVKTTLFSSTDTIFGANDESKYDQCIKEKKCGIVLCKNEKNKYSIEIYNPRLIHDLEIAFETLKEKINNEDDSPEKTRLCELELVEAGASCDL